MALDNYKVAYDNSYEEVFNKVLVAKDIANMRFEPTLTYGGSVTRFTYDISGVKVRTVSRGSASTIDTISDGEESLTINIEKEISFHLSDGEITQTGPLNPGEVIGAQAAVKIATDLDARVLAEVLNAAYTFDTGDLTTTSSTGVPFSLTTTTVPQMVTRMPAKLKANNQVLTNMALVVDPYAAADIEQFLLGKEFDVVNSVFKNGYAGAIATAQVYVSNNLTGSAVLGLATQVTANDTVTVNGLTFTFVASPSAEGDIDIGSNVDGTRANLAAALNQGAGAGTAYIAFTGSNLSTLEDLKVTATNNDTANTLTVVCKGSGRLTVSETLTAGTDAWSKNTLHAYYGKKGAIDLVVQDKSEVDVRATSDRRGYNIFSSYLAGLKTFADGAKKFLNVKLAA